MFVGLRKREICAEGGVSIEAIWRPSYKNVLALEATFSRGAKASAAAVRSTAKPPAAPRHGHVLPPAKAATAATPLSKGELVIRGA